MHKQPQRILGALALSLAASCGGTTKTNLQPQTYTGRASAAPIVGGTVTVHALDANGNVESQLGSGPTDANGNFSLSFVPSFPIQLSVSGGTYHEEADGNTVSVNVPLRCLLADGNTTNVGITPLTEIAASRALANNGNGMAEAIEDAQYAVAQASGLPSILTPPADPNAPGADPNSAAAQYALFLAGMSQLAAQNGQSSLVVTVALSQDFRHDGQFNGSDNGNAVVVDPNMAGSNPNQPPPPPFALSPNAWTVGISTATTVYLHDPNANHGGFSSQSQTTLNGAPPLVAPRDPNGQHGGNPNDMSSNPNTPPASSGDANSMRGGDPNMAPPPPTNGDPNSMHGGDPNMAPPPPTSGDPNNGGTVSVGGSVGSGGSTPPSQGGDANNVPPPPPNDG